MSNVQVIISFNGAETNMQCKSDEKFEEICKRFANKMLTDINNLSFVYNGNTINKDLNFIQHANEEDKKRNVMNVFAFDISSDPVANENIVNSKEIICPICKENIFININNYKINLLGCKNNHNINNILLKNYENTQKIDISKIICNICTTANKSNTYKKELHFCLNCKINICPLCKLKHNSSHAIINYDLKDYICNIHNDILTSYCNDCNLNLCYYCEKGHKNHNTIYYGDIVPNDNTNEELQKYIDELKIEIKNMIDKLNSLLVNMDIYNNLNKKIYENKNRNYIRLKNISEIIKFNKIVINDIKEVINENNMNNKFSKLMSLYDNINNNNFISGEFEIKRNDINKNIRILNSFEQYKRENHAEIKEQDNIYINEKEIKDNIRIKINGKLIPFSYFYKFNQEGKYKIEYIFSNKITRTVFMFLGCKNLININLSNFNPEGLVNMNAMFYDCDSLISANLSNLNTKNATNMGCMLYGCKKLKNLNLLNFNTEKVENMNGMFAFCESLDNIDLSSFKTQNVTNMCCIFRGCKKLQKIDLSKFNTIKVTNMNSMFFECESLNDIDLSSFDTKNVTDLGCMFGNCKNLKNIKLSNFDTEKVTVMNGMFAYCNSLNIVDLSSFKTQNVTNMSCLFNGCKKLANINLSNFTTQKVTDMNGMFANCELLASVNLSNFNTQRAINMDNIFQGCKSLRREKIITRDQKILNAL